MPFGAGGGEPGEGTGFGAGSVQLGEQDAMQLVEDAGLLPAVQRAPAGCPDPNPSSRGRSCQAMSWCRTYRMPCRHSRSSTGFGPGDRLGQGRSRGSISAHKSSSTIHGRVVTPLERPNRHNSHALPGHFSKILLRAL